jgi:hypothetical protein
MSLFDRFFRSGKVAPRTRGTEDLEGHLQGLEAQARGAAAGTRGTILNRAGDLCVRAGDPVRALRYFGAAIDALLDDHQPEPARAVAKKILRVHPGAVRTLCTLTWLDLAARQHKAAEEHLKQYVKATVTAGQEALAWGPVLEMGALARDPEFLREAAAALEELGVPRDAGRVREWAAFGGSPRATSDPSELSSLCFKAAVGSNLRRRTEGAVA